MAFPDLFANESALWGQQGAMVRLAPGTALLPGFAEPFAERLVAGIREIVRQAPFRQMQTPGGRRMGIATTNCGELGWISDRHGYCYSSVDPESDKPWPAIPLAFARLATSAALLAGFQDFLPDSCLINCYLPGTRLSLHQDRDEQSLAHPIVSISLGVSAQFLFGGQQRNHPVHLLNLYHGDVLVWGGTDRLRFHGVKPIAAAHHPMLGARRVNLTFRKAA